MQEHRTFEEGDYRGVRQQSGVRTQIPADCIVIHSLLLMNCSTCGGQNDAKYGTTLLFITRRV